MAEDGVVVERPNRKKASSRATRTIVVVLLLASAFLLALITIGAWDALVGAKPLQVIWILLYLLMAFLVARWNRGVLPLAAAMGMVMLIFALVSVPGWFERDKDGFTDPTIPSDVVGLLTALVVPLQLLLIAFAMRGFQQRWNVEVEHPADSGGRRDPAAAPA